MKKIDWSKVKSGDRFTAEIKGEKCEGNIHKTMDEIFFCQNKVIGAESPNKYDFENSYVVCSPNPSDSLLSAVSVTNLKIYSQSKTKPMAKKTNKEYTFTSYQTVGKAKWEIYAYHDANNKKRSSFIVDGKKYVGNFCYGNRLVSTANGNIITGNKGFNTKQAALKNVVLVGRVSVLAPRVNYTSIQRIPVTPVREKFSAGVLVKNGKRVDAAKTRQDVVDAINAYGYLKPKRTAAAKKKVKK